MAYHREEFGRDLRELLQRRGSYREVQAGGIAFSQVGDLCNGVIHPCADKLIAGLDLDPVEWMVSRLCPRRLEGDALVLALGRWARWPPSPRASWQRQATTAVPGEAWCRPKTP